jgi:TRAP-type C4-dicarboxylate transport system substrate-binding protein
LAAAAALPARADAITLRLADGMPSGHIIDRLVIEPFMKQVAEATHGQVVIQHFPAEQLGKSRDLLLLTEAGVTDIGFIVPSYVADRLPLSAVMELPGIFQTTCQGDAALRALLDEGGMLDELEFRPNGIRPLMVFLLPAYQLVLSTARPFEGIKSVAGLKIRTPGGAMDLTAQALGAVPIRMSPPEIYESMSRGTLDGALLSYQSVTSYHLPALLKSGTLGQDFGTVAVTFSISTRVWDALPADVRRTIGDIGHKISTEACTDFDKAEDAAIATVRKAKVRLVEPADSEKSQLADAFAEVRAEWAKRLDARGKPGSAVLAAFLKAAAEAKPQ